jgi:hypothetical protein
LPLLPMVGRGSRVELVPSAATGHRTTPSTRLCIGGSKKFTMSGDSD